MTIADRVYGQIDVTSAVILELIKSRPMQRLKGIGQFGIPDEFYQQANFSRYEHSLGVMLLLKRLGASEEEQVAGLLHDVSHTAFSHIIDWVVGDGKTEDFQDNQHEQYVLNSEIPGILERHGLTTKRIVDYKHFNLLERGLPDLCADRVDYSLREFPTEVVATCVPALKNWNNQIVFTTEVTALLFAENFLKLQMEHWGGPEAVARYRLFGDVLRQALQDGTITMDDFWHDDAFVVNKLNESKNPKLHHLLEGLRSNPISRRGPSQKSITVRKKFRYVDPSFIDGDGKLIQISDVNQKFAKELESARRTNKLGVAVPALV